MHNAASETAPQSAWSIFGHFRALSGTFGHFRAKPESARKCPKVPESARMCSRHFRAVSEA
eukprot:2637691-Alexandrium_andersonii.AAC.1